jgi:hypothetical protein
MTPSNTSRWIGSERTQNVFSKRFLMRGFSLPPSAYQLRDSSSFQSHGTGDYFPRVKRIGMWTWPLISIYCRDSECVELYLYSPIHLHDVVSNFTLFGITLRLYKNRRSCHSPDISRYVVNFNGPCHFFYTKALQARQPQLSARGENWNFHTAALTSAYFIEWNRECK